MTVKQSVVEKRVHRKPLHQQGPQNILGEKDPNFHYRIVNDTGNRIEAFQQAGYELVTDDDIIVGDSRVSSAGDLGSSKRIISGDGNTAYLMRIPLEYYQEDQKAKEEKIKDQERSMKDESSQGLYGNIKTFTK